MVLVLATANRHKIRELETLLGDLPFQLCPLPAAASDPPLPEPGPTLAANAEAKALAAAARTGYLALADDSGLEVDPLGGEPGLRSSRFLGEGATDAERTGAILAALRTYPWHGRTARFRCAVAVADATGRVLCRSEGVLEGVIAFEARGTGGFGYDPIFFVPELSQTLAEAGPAVKNRISHRAQALLACRPILAALAAGSATEALPR
ncbi:MAG TPA: non-canonical purine NTP pyrophosphatase [Candidatus Methylomirabilis sp.]|jgi:XTP/dITP diphosphohydrolase|nr:non-canonical purine NTP pyrophosphatase [Candidatus Methylomirabilis sp.]